MELAKVAYSPRIVAKRKAIRMMLQGVLEQPAYVRFKSQREEKTTSRICVIKPSEKSEGGSELADRDQSR